MKEKEFDQYVKELLQDAEVEVSPRVWKGIAAQLGAARPVFPVWGWALVSMAAAVVLVVLLQAVPLATLGYSTEPVLAETTLPANELQWVKPAQDELSRPEYIFSDAERLLVSAIPSARLENGRVSSEALQPSARMRGVGSNSLSARVDDSYLLNQLAYAAREEEDGRGFSLMASGNFQGNERGRVSNAALFSRPFSAPAVGAGEGIYNETPETNFRLPFSVGLTVRYNFTSRWALGTGLRYTNLGRTFVGDFVSKEGIIIPQTDIDNQQHWLGIPLNLYYDIVNRGRWRVHAFVGGAADFLVINDFLIHYSPKDLHYYQNGETPQWSAAVGLGLEYRLTPALGIYVDPNVRYYFNAEQQPRSLRTIQPLRIDVEVGMRFSFGNL